MPAVLLQNVFDGMVSRPLDAKMLLDTPFPMNFAIIDQLASNLVDICLHNMLQILRNSLLCFAKIGRLTAPKLPRFGL